MQLSFHSILSSDKEVDFFTDIILETGLPGDLDHSTLAMLETVPEEVLLEEENTAIEEQCEIEVAIEAQYECYVIILDHTNGGAEESFGTLKECISFVQKYSRLVDGHSFIARFFDYGNDNELAYVEYFPTDTNPTGYNTITKLNY